MDQQWNLNYNTSNEPVPVPVPNLILTKLASQISQ